MELRSATSQPGALSPHSQANALLRTEVEMLEKWHRKLEPSASLLQPPPAAPPELAQVLPDLNLAPARGRCWSRRGTSLGCPVVPALAQRPGCLRVPPPPAGSVSSPCGSAVFQTASARGSGHELTPTRRRLKLNRRGCWCRQSGRLARGGGGPVPGGSARLLPAGEACAGPGLPRLLRVPLLRGWCSPPPPWSREQAAGADQCPLAQTSPFRQSHREQESASSSPAFAC